MTRAAPPSVEGTRQVLANGAALLGAYVLPRVFTLASVVLAARLLGPEAFGVYGTAAAFAVVFSILATLGMQPLLIREIARAPERAGSLLAAAHAVKTGTNLLMLGAVLAASPVLLDSDPRARAAALVLALGYAMGAYAENLAAYHQAVERMERWTQASAIFGIVSGSVGAGLLLLTGSLVAFCWGPAVGWTAALGWLLVRAPEPVRSLGPVRRGDVVELLRGLAPFGAAFVGVTVYSKIDVLLLARLRGDAAVGVYTAAYKFVDLFQALVIVAAGAVYPRLSRTAGDGSDGAWRGGRSTELVLLAAVPAGFALHLLAAPLTGLLFGGAYEASVPVLRALALVLPLLALSIHGGYVLGAAGRMLPVAGLYLVGVAVNVALNLALVPTLGPAGAAWARLGSETVLAAGLVMALHVVARAGPGVRVLGLAAAAAAIGLAARLLPDPSAGWIQGGAALVGWTALYGLGGALDPAEWRVLRATLPGAPSHPPEGATGEGAS